MLGVTFGFAMASMAAEPAVRIPINAVPIVGDGVLCCLEDVKDEWWARWRGQVGLATVGCGAAVCFNKGDPTGNESGDGIVAVSLVDEALGR